MNLENYQEATQNSVESIKTIDQLIEKINTPEELLAYMGKSIKYGYVSRENNKIYSVSDVDFDEKFDDEYFLQTPEQLLISKHGVCWDQAELERVWFSKKDYDFKTYFLMFVKEEINNLPTHTFLTYQDKDKFYWFENSFEANRGLHEYDSFEALAEDVKNKHFELAKKCNGATDEDLNNLKFYNYEVPKFGLNPDEFMQSVTSI